MRTGSASLALAVLTLTAGCSNGEPEPAAGPDWLVLIETSSGFSRDDPPVPGVYDSCRLLGAAGIANELGFDTTLDPGALSETEVAIAYTDRVAPTETEAVRTEVFVSCAFGFGP